MYKFLLLLLVLITNLTATWMDVEKLPDSREHKKPRALNIVEARQSIGYPDFLAKNSEKGIRSVVPIVIIDAGFVGLQEYWKKNPDKKKKVKEWITFYKDGKKATAHHGFDVYRSALGDAPNSEYYLFQVDLSDVNSFHRALKYMKKKKLYMANFSVGITSFYGEDDEYMVKIHKFLEKYQITLFQSIGNERGRSHYFKYRDENGNKVLEFIKPTTKKIRTFEFNRLGFFKNTEGTIYLKWQRKDEKDIKDKIEVRLVDKKNKKLPIIIKKQSNKLIIKYTSEKDQRLFLQIIDKGIVNPKDKHFSLYVKNINTSKMYANGFGVSAELALKESPFVIAVGSYGMGEDGKLVPSSFSSFTKTVDGALLPHIMGPGQLKIGEKSIEGTSFSSPFISAFYAKYNGYNIKNLVESTSTKRLLSKNILPVEEARWGVPDVMSVSKSNCFLSDKVENFKTEIKDKNIVVEFDYSRRCMEGLQYKVVLKLNGSRFTPEGVFEKVIGEKYYSSKIIKSLTKHIDKQHVSIEVPFLDLQEEFGGTFMKASFYIMTRNTKKPDSFRVKGKFDFKIPLGKEKDPEDLAIFDKAYDYFLRGLNSEAVRLIDKGLSKNLFDVDNVKEPLELQTLKAILLLRGDSRKNYDEAYEILDNVIKNIPENYKFMDRLLKYKAALHYGIGNYKTVIKIVEDFSSKGFYDRDMALLEYFSYRFLKKPKTFRVGDDKVSPLVGKYLSKNIEKFPFFNALGKIKNEEPREYQLILWNFILLQEALLKPAEKKTVYSLGKRVIQTQYVDHIYFVITKSQFGEYKQLKKVIKAKQPNQTKQNKTMQISRFWNSAEDDKGKKTYYQINFEIIAEINEDDIIALLQESMDYMDLPMKKGFYIYNGDKSVDEKMLSFFKSKGTVKSLKITKLVIQ